MGALTKVDVPLMERYTITCASCGYLRQIIGTKAEARRLAELMGWEFRVVTQPNFHAFDLPTVPMTVELAYCLHCKLLVKP